MSGRLDKDESTKSRKKDGLEKKIHKSAILETVAALNANLDSEREGDLKKDNQHKPSTAGSGKQKKATKLVGAQEKKPIADEDAMPAKQKRNALRKPEEKIPSATKKGSVSSRQKKVALEEDKKSLSDDVQSSKVKKGKGVADNHGLFPSKQTRNAMKKMKQDKTPEELSNGTKEKNASGKAKSTGKSKKQPVKSSEETSKKMTRKERKQEKIKTKGKGISSKEYYDTVIKKSKASERSESQSKATRETFPSKRKEEFPSDKEDSTKRRKPIRKSSSAKPKK